MVHEVDQVIDKFLEAENGIVEIKSSFNTAVLNVLWQIVASKKFDPDHPETKEVIMLMNAQAENRYSKSMFFPTLFKILPFRDVDIKLFRLKEIMGKYVREHLQDIDYENPRDFMDVYITQMKDEGTNFNEQQLVLISLDLF